MALNMALNHTLAPALGALLSLSAYSELAFWGRVQETCKLCGRGWNEAPPQCPAFKAGERFLDSPAARSHGSLVMLSLLKSPNPTPCFAGDPDGWGPILMTRFRRVGPPLNPDRCHKSHHTGQQTKWVPRVAPQEVLQAL